MTTSASHLNPSNEVLATQAPPKPRPAPLTASAKRITGKSIKRAGSKSIGKNATETSWQDDAWEMYDLVGEERFLATTLAGRIGQARLYVGRVSDDDVYADPEPVEETDDPAAQVFDKFAMSGAQRSQILTRAGANLFIAGEGYLVGVPNPMVERGGPETVESSGGAILPIMADSSDGPDLNDLDWRFLAAGEVKFSDNDDSVSLEWAGAPDGVITDVPADDILLIRVWKPHPRRFSAADSPTRSSLPVLRELVGLTMHVSAQVDSRLSGAGLLLVRQSVKAAAEASDNPDDEPTEFEDALIDAMIEPISDRSNASALVPLVVGVPDNLEGAVSDHVAHISFASELDAEARELRDEAIRRLALGQDAPPELLLGMATMNHWGAWLVREDVVTTHVEPYVALMCDAITTDFLWPALESEDIGMSREEARKYVVWYSVEHMVSRPNKFDEAKDLHASGVIDDETYREAGGYGPDAAPQEVATIDPAVQTALDLATAAPSLAQTPGLPALVEQIRAIMSGEPVAAPTAPEEPADDPAPADGENGEEGPAPSEDGGIPDTAGDPAEPPEFRVTLDAPNFGYTDPERETAVRRLAALTRTPQETRRG